MNPTTHHEPLRIAADPHGQFHIAFGWPLPLADEATNAGMFGKTSTLSDHVRRSLVADESSGGTGGNSYPAELHAPPRVRASVRAEVVSALHGPAEGMIGMHPFVRLASGMAGGAVLQAAIETLAGRVRPGVAGLLILPSDAKADLYASFASELTPRGIVVTIAEASVLARFLPIRGCTVVTLTQDGSPRPRRTG